MVFGDDSPPLRGGEEGNAGRFNKRAQIVLGTRPQYTAAREYHRFARLSQQLDSLANQRWVAGWAGLGTVVTADPVDPVFLDLAGQDITGQVEVDGTALGIKRFAKGNSDVFRNAIAEVDTVGRFHDRPHHRYLVHFLEG